MISRAINASKEGAFDSTVARVIEHRHRRFVLMAVAALLLLSLSPVFGHHLSGRLDRALLGQDHIWILCMIAIHTLLAPVHGLFHILLAAGVGFALVDRAVAWNRFRRTMFLLTTESGETFDRVMSAAQKAQVDAGRIRVVDRLPSPAFTAGMIRPSIFIDRSVLDVLSPSQLVALLAHEGVHLQRRDPLRLTLLRFLACCLFWIPAFRRLAADVADEVEIIADDAAAGTAPLVLASAILALAQWPNVRTLACSQRSLGTDATVGLVGSTNSDRQKVNFLLERRIRRLAGESSIAISHLTRGSLVSAIAVLVLAWSSGIAVAHPMQDAGSGKVHCSHQHASSLSHLFCQLDDVQQPSGLKGTNSNQHCPHSAMVSR